MMNRIAHNLRLPIRLAIGAAISFTIASHPAVQSRIRMDGRPPIAGYGPICLLRSAPDASTLDVWRLDHPRLILPYDLIAAGYSEAELAEYKVVARVTCTAYTSRPCETDSTPNITASNKSTRWGYIALSRDLLSHYTPGAPFRYGDRIELVGIGTFQVEDTMNPRWRRRADIWVQELDTARGWGKRTVLIAKLGEDHDGDLADLEVITSGRGIFEGT